MDMSNISINDFLQARNELGEKEYYNRICFVFGKPVLNFVRSLVVNLPEPCYANCSYCIDNKIRNNSANTKDFLTSCEKTFKEFDGIEEVALTGGSLKASDFNYLVNMIDSYYPNVKITWNTNGIMIDDKYDISKIRYINLHRNSVDDKENRKIFQSNKYIMTINEAKELFGDKLFLRITIDENFNIDDYIKFNVPLYINRMMPKNENTELVFESVLDKINVSRDADYRRRNEYLNCEYKNIPIRVCMGDSIAKRVSNRYPLFLNVAIIHRSGSVCGTWYEDDKTLYKINKNS